jgi:hypothetical protein
MRLDYSNVPNAALSPVLEAWLVEIEARPLTSIRALVVPSRGFVAAADAIKRFGERATPHVLALALVTPEPFHRAFLWSMAPRGPRHIAAFEDEAAGRAWLASITGAGDAAPGSTRP